MHIGPKLIQGGAPLAPEGVLLSTVAPSSLDAVVAVVLVDSNAGKSRRGVSGDLPGPPEPSCESWVKIKVCVNSHRHAAEKVSTTKLQHEREKKREGGEREREGEGEREDTQRKREVYTCVIFLKMENM